MKTKIITFIILSFTIFISCENLVEENFLDPSKTTKTSSEFLMTGVFETPKNFYMPYYQRHFIFTNPSVGIYCQSKGWINGNKQYIPGSGSFDKWNTYYKMLRQYRELELQMAKEDKPENRIFMIAATIFFYDRTQLMVDLWGDLPWSEAGKLKEFQGDINASKAKFDKAEDIYTTMLDDLKSIADELNTIEISSLTSSTFVNQDLINGGDLNAWKRYCNSLRLRLLIRIADVPEFQSRLKAEFNEIISNPEKYPVASNIAENIQVEATGSLTHDQQGEKGIRGALESWDADNITSSAMVQFMVDNSDPRIEPMLAPNEDGEYIGLDPLLNADEQNKLLSSKSISRLDTATFSRNIYVPGILISASEVSFIKAEAIQRGYASGDAKVNYETGVKQAIENLYAINALSDYAPALDFNPALINTYLEQAEVNWDNNANKIELIATQKWLDYNYLQPEQSWTEIRRTGYPKLKFKEDTSTDLAKLPPTRLLYPSDEASNNAENYAEVKSEDNLTTQIFWDKN